MLNGIQDCVASEPEVFRQLDGAGRLRDATSDSDKDVLLAVLEAVSTVRALRARGLREVGDFSGYSQSRSTLAQFLQRGRVSSHLTLRLRHTKLRTL